MSHRTLALALAIGCNGDPSSPGPMSVPRPEPPTPTELQAIADTVRGLAEDEGYTVGEGLFSFATYEHCCEPDVNCLGNNPSTPYGMIALPEAPEQGSPDVDSFWMWGSLPDPSLSRSFRMRADEAIVWIGTMPPKSKYFSYRSSIATRQNPSGQRDLVLGSLGPSLNQLVVADDLGVETDEVWGRPMAIVTAADYGAEDSAVQWLIAAGFAPSEIHRDRISALDTRLGLSPASDTLMGVVRVAVSDDPEAFALWQQQGAQVLRLTPPDERASAPMSREPMPERGEESTELPWLQALLDLDAAIRARWPEITPRTPEMLAGFTETFVCIDDLSCYGDIRDRYATRTLDVRLPDDAAFLLTFGVNHELAGKSAYSNVAVMTFDNRVGVAAFESPQMPGTARPYLGDDYPLVDDLYAWVISRDCSRFSDVACLEIEDTCPHPEPGEAFYITSRMYLDPSTGAAAGDGEILTDRVLEFIEASP